VKFHWKPVLGLQSVTWNEAVKINGADPDFHRRDLWNSITAGDFPEWELGVQVFDDEFADSFDFDVLDATKLIPEEILPVRPIGKMVLDRVVDNFFAETEQVAFCTQNVVPGIDFTNDPLLQGRNFSYLDTQLKRLGSPNFTHIPVNAPRCPVAHFQQDGHMAMSNPVGRANYEPNSWGDEGGPREDPTNGFRSFPASDDGAKRRLRPESFADHYSQARMFYRSQTPVEQTHLGDAIVFELSKVDGADAKTLRMLRKAAEAEGMTMSIVAPTVEGVVDSEGGAVHVAEKIDGGPSVLFDAVAVVLATDRADEIAALPGAKDFVSDAHAHQKYVAYTDAAAALFAAAAVDHESGPGYRRLDGTRKTADDFVQTCRQVRAWDRIVG
jgi:catalase